MKLGVSYIVFDGVELLEYSIKQIRKHVDYLQVIYQDKSWFGDPIKREDLLILQRLKNIGLIDDLTLFSSFNVFRDKSNNSIVNAKGYERAKRQAGLNSCLANKCSHFLCMDVDEFYIESEFKKAKDYIIEHKLHATSVKFINYVNIPTMHRGIDGSTVPFICQIHNKCLMGKKFFSKCDPTRGILHTGTVNGFHMFNHNDIKMHHMETIRKDIKLKYDSTTRSMFDRSKTNELVSNIKSVDENTLEFGFNRIIFPGTPKGKLYKVDNIFNIPYKEWQK